MRVTRAIPAIAVAGLALAAVPAGATISLPSFSLTPSTTTQGANPDVTIDSRFASPDGDTPRNLAIQLPPGMTIDPTAVSTPCSDAQLQANGCPAGSLVGSATTSGTAAGSQATLVGKLYLVAPQTGELARLGIVAQTSFGTVTFEAGIVGSPSTGLAIGFANLPKTLFGAPVTLSESKVTISGSIAGKAFVGNPTTCSPATSKLTVTGWNDPTPVTATSSFTPTGCGSAGSSHTKKAKHKKHHKKKHKAKKHKKH